MKSRMVSFAILFSSVTLFAAEPAVIQQLRSDLVGKEFQLRSAVAGSTCLYDVALSRPTSRLVDTEFSQSGGIQYFLRTDRFMNIRTCAQSLGNPGDTTLSGLYIAPRFISVMHRAGETVTVKKVEGKNDRVEIQIAAAGMGSGDESYGKIKLMTGDAYQTWTLQEMESTVSRAMYLPRIHNVEVATAALISIQNSIALAEQDLQPSKSAEVRSEAAGHLPALYNSEAAAIGQVNQVAYTPVPAPKHPYTIEALRSIQLDAIKQSNQERTASALKAYTDSKLATKTACDSLPSPTAPASTREELDGQTSAVRSFSQKAAAFDVARAEIDKMGQPITKEDEAFEKQCRTSSSALSATFPNKQRHVEEAEAAKAEAEKKHKEEVTELQRQKQTTDQIATLNSGYRQMSKERSTLDAKLVETFGQAEQGQVLYQYRMLLEKMIANRQEALALGYKEADAQIRLLNEQLAKLQ